MENETVNEDTKNENGGAEPQGTAAEGQVSWRDGLSDELRDSPVLAKYDSEEAALKALVGAQRLIGQKGLIAPGEGASAEEISAYRAARRGGVHSPADYRNPAEFSAERLAELGFDEAAMSGIRQTAFDIGLDADGYGQFLANAAKDVSAARQANIARHNAAVEALGTKLQQEWGDAFSSRIADGKALMEQMGIWDAVAASGLDANENFVRFIDEAVKVTTREGILPKNGTRGVSATETMREVSKSKVVSDFRNPDTQADAVRKYAEACARVAEQGRRNGGVITL